MAKKVESTLLSATDEYVIQIPGIWNLDISLE